LWAGRTRWKDRHRVGRRGRERKMRGKKKTKEKNWRIMTEGRKKGEKE